jgi:hypothetical protein
MVSKLQLGALLLDVSICRIDCIRCSASWQERLSQQAAAGRAARAREWCAAVLGVLLCVRLVFVMLSVLVGAVCVLPLHAHVVELHRVTASCSRM